MCRDEGTCRGVTIQVRHMAWHDTYKGQCLQKEKVGPVSFSLNQPLFAERDNLIRLKIKTAQLPLMGTGLLNNSLNNLSVSAANLH